MQLKLATLLFFVLALCAYTSSALPASARPVEIDLPVNQTEIETISFTEHVSKVLAKRTEFPIKNDDKLKAKIMVAIKAKVKGDIVARISGSVSEKIKASFDIKVKVLGGLISLGNARISARQSAAIKKVEGKLSASIDANLETDVYADLETELSKLLKKYKFCSEKELLKIISKLEGHLISKLKVKLPQICAKLKSSIQASVDACIKDLEVNIPLILTIKINSSFKLDVAVKTFVNVAAKICADLKAKADAHAILRNL